MTAEQRAQFQRRLLRDRATVTATLDRITTAMTAVAELPGGYEVPGDEPQAGTTGVGPHDDAAIAVRATSELAEIDAALTQLYEHPDRYGICAICDNPIPLRRLDLIPATRYCGRHA